MAMKEVVVRISGSLTKNGEPDIVLSVSSYYVGRTSPCVVTNELVKDAIIGGPIESLEQIFQLQIDNHLGYVVKDRQDLVAVVECD